LLWRKVQCITLVPQFKMDVGFGFAAVVWTISFINVYLKTQKFRSNWFIL
jgi:hypothetical protein